jgi:hypothetical protein
MEANSDAAPDGAWGSLFSGGCYKDVAPPVLGGAKSRRVEPQSYEETKERTRPAFASYPKVLCKYCLTEGRNGARVVVREWRMERDGFVL